MGYLSGRVRRWSIVQQRCGTNGISLVFHTSCVNYNMEDLQELRQDKTLTWLIPQDVTCELRLMCSSHIPGYRERAKYILQAADLCGEKCPWNLSDLYSGRRRPPDGFTMLFIFGDRTMQDEFLQNAHAVWDKQYIFFQSEWSCTNYIEEEPCVLPLYKARTRPACTVHPLNEVVKTDDFFQLNTVSRNHSTVRVRELMADRQYRSGSYADIRVYPGQNGVLYKCFKKHALTGTRKSKLETMAKCSSCLRLLPLACPLEVLYDSQRRAVGFTMPRIQGKTLYEIQMGNIPGYNIVEVLRNLSLLLLELHTLHILVNDLSMNNIVVEPNNTVSIVDCDSFQLFGFPGGLITPDFQHIELRREECNSQLHHARHDNFAFAAVLFRYILNTGSVCKKLNDKTADPDSVELTWENSHFALDVDQNLGTSKRVFEQWKQLPTELRRAFVDEFTGRSSVSIGQWCRLLEIV